MFDIVIINFFYNLVILTLIFWAIVLVGEKFLHKKKSISSKEIYECGFLNVNKLKITPNYNFIIISILLIIYDIEFFFFIPLFFNFYYIYWYHYIYILILYYLIIVSFIFDWQAISLNWFI